MQTLPTIKEELEFISGMGEIIDAYKTAALIQFHIFQAKRSLNEDFLKEIDEAMAFLRRSNTHSRYFNVSADLPPAIAVITSDTGFLGELNSLIINRAIDQRRGKNDIFLVFGEKGALYLEDIGQEIIRLPGIPEKLEPAMVSKTADFFIRNYGVKFSSLTLVYPEFISVSEQKVRVAKFFSFDQDKGSDSRQGYFQRQIIIEPDKERVLDTLVELTMYYRLYYVLWSSKQSEYAARIMHLENGNQELNNIRGQLRAEYFKCMHVISDTTIREISAAKAMFKKRLVARG